MTAYGTPAGHYFDVEVKSDGLYLKGYTTGALMFFVTQLYNTYIIHHGVMKDLVPSSCMSL